MTIPDFLTQLNAPDSKSITFQVDPSYLVDLQSAVSLISTISSLHLQSNIRFLFHTRDSITIHKMLIFERRSFYYPPHIHVDREELHFVLRGSLEIHYLTNSGISNHSILCSSESNTFTSVPKGIPHLTRPHSDSVIYLELKNGPHVCFQDECFTPIISKNISPMQYLDNLSSSL